LAACEQNPLPGVTPVRLLAPDSNQKILTHDEYSKKGRNSLLYKVLMLSAIAVELSSVALLGKY